MISKPYFSILTASLNNGPTIEKNLVSVKHQTFDGVEHIVIDGGSQDGTLEILESYADRYALKWISEEDNGIADALNKGLVQARGQYILVIHADDYLLTPSTLESVFDLLQGNYDLHCFAVVFERPASGLRIGDRFRPLWWHRFRNIFSHQGTFVHRRVFQRIGHFNAGFTISMDYDFFYRALNSGCSVKFDQVPVSVMGGEGISSDVARRLADEFRVQVENEQNPFWRLAQRGFQFLYEPYKLRLLPKIIAASAKFRLG